LYKLHIHTDTPQLVFDHGSHSAHAPPHCMHVARSSH
jgi:hypothetical protein